MIGWPNRRRGSGRATSPPMCNAGFLPSSAGNWHDGRVKPPLATAIAVTVVSLVSAACASAGSPLVTAPGSGVPSLVTFTDGGGVLQVSDGSVWAIANDDQTIVTGWSTGDTIGEGAGGRSDELTDLDTGDIVDAHKIGEMNTKLHYAHVGERTIESIGADGTVVVLTDRSVWAITATKDAPIVNSWTFGARLTVKAVSGHAYMLKVTNAREGAFSAEGRRAALAYYIGNA